MAIKPEYRSSAAGRVFRTPYWPLRQTDLTESVLSIQATPAWFLPVIGKRADRDAPYVMYPGTFVGLLNDRDHSAIDAVFRAQQNDYQHINTSVIVPANGGAYTCTYRAYDLASDEHGGTYDIDVAGGETIVAAAGASTVSVARARPIGIVQETIWSQAFYRRSLNYQQQPMVNILSRGQVVRIPCITTEEMVIYPGDEVMVTDTPSTLDHDQTTAAQPGRLKRFSDASGAHASVDALVDASGLRVGRCIGRHKICSQASANAGDLLLDDILGSLIDTTTLNTDQGYDQLARVNTVPAVSGLQGTGTLGVPSPLTFARSNASGEYWAIDVAIGVPGV